MVAYKENMQNSFNLIDNSVQRMWDTWSINLENLSKIRSQFENMTKQQIEQNAAVHEEITRILSDIGTQMRRNQEEFQKMIQDFVMETFETVSTSGQSLTYKMPEKVEVPTKKEETKKNEPKKLEAAAVQ